MLAAIARRQQGALDPAALKDADERSLEAMVEFGGSELLSVASQLQSELSGVERNASAMLELELGRAGRDAMRQLDASADDARSAAAAERVAIAAMRRSIDELRAERGNASLTAGLDAARRRRGSLLRSGGVAARVAEISASALGLLLLLGLLDGAASLASGEGSSLGLAPLLTNAPGPRAGFEYLGW